jgi:hypothetical protein
MQVIKIKQGPATSPLGGKHHKKCVLVGGDPEGSQKDQAE